MTGIRRARMGILAFSVAMALSGCFGGGGDSAPAVSNSSTPSSTTSDVTLSGTVYAGNTSGATVTVYALDAQGKVTGDALGSVTTQANGSYTITLKAVPAGPVLLVSSGGQYTSEADGSSQPGIGMKVLVPGVQTGATVAQLNPLTSSIAEFAMNTLNQNTGTTASDAVSQARTKVKTLLGITAMTADPQTLAPDPTATSGDAWILAALAGAIEELRLTSGLGPLALYKALLDDIADGKLDGLRNLASITVGSSGTLQSSLFTTQLSGAANAYGATHAQYQGATASISAALQASAQAAGVAIGSSGSIAPLQTQSDGTQIYFAARRDGLVKLDMKDPGSPVATKLSAINSAVMGSASAGKLPSIDGIVINPTPYTDSNGQTKVYAILYSYASQKVFSVDLSNGVVAGNATIPVTNQANFSGATTYVAGGIADGQRNLVWLATAEGLLGINPADLSATPIKIAQPPNTSINENLGGDPAHDLIFSPDYDNEGIVVFNLAERKAYAMSKATWQAMNGLTNQSIELDGAALDSAYQLAIITPEHGPLVGLMGYSTPSGSSDAVGTFATSKFKLYTLPAGSSFAGSAIDTVSHTALFVGEGYGFGVGVLDDPAKPSWAGFSSFVSAPSSSYRFSPHDPHTVGAFNVGGKPYGFLLQSIASGTSAYKVAVLDLPAIVAAPATSGVLNNDPFLDNNQVKLLSY